MRDPQLIFHGRTDVGIVRDHNEDAFGFFLPEGEAPGDNGATISGGDLIAVVSDGVGGHEAGELASNATVAGVGAVLSQIACELDPADLESLRSRLDKAMAGLNTNLRSVARHRGQGKKNMAATLTAAWFAAGRLILVHAGDSRIYRWRAGKLEQLSIDDTQAGRAIANGKITEEQARADASWHILQRAMGIEERKFAVTVESFDVTDGDVYLLCSDGLTSGLSNAQLEKGFARLEAGDLAAFSERLIEAGNQASGKDNITASLIYVAPGWVAASRRPVNRPFAATPAMKHKHTMMLYGILGLIAAGLVGLAFALHQTRASGVSDLAKLNARIDGNFQQLEISIGQEFENLKKRDAGISNALDIFAQESSRRFQRYLAESRSAREGLSQEMGALGDRIDQMQDSVRLAQTKANSVSSQLDRLWEERELQREQAAQLRKQAEVADVVNDLSDPEDPAELEVPTAEGSEVAGSSPTDVPMESVTQSERK